MNINPQEVKRWINVCRGKGFYIADGVPMACAVETVKRRYYERDGKPNAQQALIGRKHDER